MGGFFGMVDSKAKQTSETTKRFPFVDYAAARARIVDMGGVDALLSTKRGLGKVYPYFTLN